MKQFFIKIKSALIFMHISHLLPTKKLTILNFYFTATTNNKNNNKKMRDPTLILKFITHYLRKMFQNKQPKNIMGKCKGKLVNSYEQ